MSEEQFKHWRINQGGQALLDAMNSGEISASLFAKQVWQAALASPDVAEFRKDAERLDFITAPESAWFVQWEKRYGKPVRYRMIDDGEVFGKWHDTARQAIDQAIASMPDKGGE